MSLTPAVTADKERKRYDNCGEELAMARAMEVLPAPGGPQRMKEGRSRWRGEEVVLSYDFGDGLRTHSVG